MAIQLHIYFRCSGWKRRISGPSYPSPALAAPSWSRCFQYRASVVVCCTALLHYLLRWQAVQLWLILATWLSSGFVYHSAANRRDSPLPSDRDATKRSFRLRYPSSLRHQSACRSPRCLLLPQSCRPDPCCCSSTRIARRRKRLD